MLDKRRRSCQDTWGVDSPASVTLSGVCPEGETRSHLVRPFLLHIILGQGQQAGFETNRSRRQANFLCRRDWLQLRSTARSEWMALLTQVVVAIFLCHLGDHSTLLNLHRGAPLVHASGCCCSTLFSDVE